MFAQQEEKYQPVASNPFLLFVEAPNDTNSFIINYSESKLVEQQFIQEMRKKNLLNNRQPDCWLS